MLRPYQQRTIDQARAAYSQGSRAILVVAPTGAGKTVIGSTIATSGAAKSRVLWLAHRQELVDQVVPRVPPGVRVTTVQALAASGERPPAEIVILDEAHHYLAAQWGAIAGHYRTALRIGLTATPERADGTPLGDLFDHLVVSASYSELLAGGWIVPCEVYAPDKRRGSLAMTPGEAVRDLAAGRQSIVFCATVQEARDAAATIRGAACVDGETDGSVRKDLIEQFRAGELATLTNVYCLTEGFDAPAAAVCVIARGCSHSSTYLQMVGRVLRPAGGKQQATLVDLCGVVHDHGWPTEDRAYSLTGEGIKRGGTKVVIWQCKGCGICLPAAPPNRICTECGSRIPEPEALRIARRRLERKERDAIAPPDQQAKAWDEIVKLARIKGYKMGWAWHRFRSRFGCDPPRSVHA